MTANQIAYYNAVENARSNRAKEAETNRSNVAQESETHRANRVNEKQKNWGILLNARDSLYKYGTGLPTNSGTEGAKAAASTISGIGSVVRGIGSIVPF